MNGSIITTISSMFAILLFTAACTTGQNTRTANQFGNYTANVDPTGTTGK